MNIPADSA